MPHIVTMSCKPLAALWVLTSTSCDIGARRGPEGPSFRDGPAGMAQELLAGGSWIGRCGSPGGCGGFMGVGGGDLDGREREEEREVPLRSGRSQAGEKWTGRGSAWMLGGHRRSSNRSHLSRTVA